MNKLITALSLSIVGLIAAGAIYFSPNQQVTVGATPTSGVPIELNSRSGSPVVDGEVTTTAYQVNYTNGQASTGTSVLTDTRVKFTAQLADGEYLVKSTPTAGSQLVNVWDVDGTVAVPSGSNCGNLYDCSWIWVQNGSWGLRGNAPTVNTAEFRFDRPTPPPTPQPATTVSPTSTGARTAAPTNVTVAPASRQTVIVRVYDETNSSTSPEPMAGVATLVTYADEATQIPSVVAGRTDSAGRASHTSPVAAYMVNVVPPAGYELAYTSQLGAHSAVDDPTSAAIHVATVRRVAQASTSQPAGAAPSPNPTRSEPTQVAVPAPVVAPQPSPQPAPTTTAPPTAAPPAEPEPEKQAEPKLGCDESNDPEIKALLWLNDGALRWMEDGEMITLYPEPGMDPVQVCLDAYHRMTELGLDIDYYTVRP